MSFARGFLCIGHEVDEYVNAGTRCNKVNFDREPVGVLMQKVHGDEYDDGRRIAPTKQYHKVEDLNRK